MSNTPAPDAGHAAEPITDPLDLNWLEYVLPDKVVPIVEDAESALNCDFDVDQFIAAVRREVERQLSRLYTAPARTAGTETGGTK